MTPDSDRSTPPHSSPQPPSSPTDLSENSLAALQALIHQKYGLAGDALDPDKPMTELGLDSLAIAEFLFEVEDRFAIRLEDDDPDVDTLRKLSVLVDRALASKAAAAS